jgi:hypothetical protein
MSISNQKGDIGEASFVLAAVKKGYYVGKMPQDCPYDYVLDKGDGPKRVQVKFRSLAKNGTICIHTTSASLSSYKEYTVSTVDYFAVYIPDIDNVFLIPANDVLRGSSSAFRYYPTKNNQSENVRFITEYKDW